MTIAIVGAIVPSLRRAEAERVKRTRPDSLDAYDLVIQAQADVDSGLPDRAINALALIERALAIDPGYALAHAYAAMSYHNRFLRGGLREQDRTASIRHAQAAILHGQDDAVALTSRLFHWDGRPRSRCCAHRVRDRARHQSVVGTDLHSWQRRSGLGRSSRACNRLERTGYAS